MGTFEKSEIIGVGVPNMPDKYDIFVIKYIQVRKHRKKRINKKWLKKYGVKQTLVACKGWKIKAYTDGTYEFIK